MSCVLSQCQPELPPRPTPIPSTSRRTPYPRSSTIRWTYGASLSHPPFNFPFHDDRVDLRPTYGADLVRILQACLAHSPSHRPKLKTLLSQVNGGVRKNPMRQAEKQWVVDSLYGPGQIPGQLAAVVPATVGVGQLLDFNSLAPAPAGGGQQQQQQQVNVKGATI